MTRPLAPTLVVLALGTLLHAAPLFQPLRSLSHGGSFMGAVTVTALLCVLLQNLLARRPAAAPAWLALPPAAIVLLGVAGVAGQIRQARLAMIEEPIDFLDRAFAFGVAVHDATAVTIQACALAALALSHAAWLVSARNPRVASARSAQWTLAVVAGLLAAALLVVWRLRAGLPLAAAGTLTPLLVLLAIPGLAIAAQRLSVDAGEWANRKAWGTLITSGVCAAGSAALCALAGWLSTTQEAYDRALGESEEPALKSRWLAQVAHNARDELALGLLAVLAIVAIAAIVALSRTSWASLRALRNPAAALCAVAMTAAAPFAQALQLMREFPQYRAGRDGELVADASQKPGTLLVDLRPHSPSVDVGLDAEIKASTGAVARWKPSVPARIDDLPPGGTVTLSIGFPYLVREAPTLRMPDDRGAHVSLGVLRTAPLFLSTAQQERADPEKILHLDLTNPGAYVLYWAVGSVVHTTRQLPRSMPALSEAVLTQWREQGSHKNENDRRHDNAIVHYAAPLDFQDVARHVALIGAHTRSFKGVPVPVFSTYVAEAPREAPADLDEELAATDFAFLDPSEAATRARDAIRKCQGRPCGSLQDLWGVRLRERCAEPLCSAATQADLWTHLGKALAAQGAVAEAARAFATARALDPSTSPQVASAAEQEALRALAALPSSNLRMGAASVSGRLPPESIRTGLQSRLGLLRACHAEALQTNPNLQGRYSVRFVIGRDGAADNFANAGSDIPAPSMIACCTRALRGLRFPPPEGGIVTVVQPFLFRP